MDARFGQPWMEWLNQMNISLDDENLRQAQDFWHQGWHPGFWKIVQSPPLALPLDFSQNISLTRESLEALEEKTEDLHHLEWIPEKKADPGQLNRKNFSNIPGFQLSPGTGHSGR